VEVPFLIVNTHSSQRTFVKQNEWAGQKDIRELVQYAAQEEKWVYLPDKELWIEMGMNAKKIDGDDRLGFQVFSSIKEIKKIFLTEKKLIDYHFHPETCHFTDSKAKAFLKESNIENTENNLRMVKANYFIPVQNICSAMPGRDDLLQLLVSSSLFYQIHPDGDFCHKVVSPYGITSYSIKEDKKDIVKNLTIDEARSLANQLAFHMNEYINCKLTLKHNHVQNRNTGIKIIRQTVRRFNHLDLVHIEFNPNKELQ